MANSGPQGGHTADLNSSFACANRLGRAGRDRWRGRQCTVFGHAFILQAVWELEISVSVDTIHNSTGEESGPILTHRVVEDGGIGDQGAAADRIGDDGIVDQGAAADRVGDGGIVDKGVAADRVGDDGIVDQGVAAADAVEDDGIVDQGVAVVADRVEHGGIVDGVDGAFGGFCDTKVLRWPCAFSTAGTKN